MNIEKRVEIGILGKYYNNLLTERQKNIVCMYVDNNLSLAEISEELNITRQAVKDALDNAVQILISTEEKLSFVKRDKKLKQSIDKIEDATLKNEILAILEEE